MLLACNFGANFHAQLSLYPLEPFQARGSYSFETSRMGPWLPYSGTEYMDTEIVKLPGSRHDLQLGFSAAWAGDHDRRDAFVEETPFGYGYDVELSFHNIY